MYASLIEILFIYFGRTDCDLYNLTLLSNCVLVPPVVAFIGFFQSRGMAGCYTYGFGFSRIFDVFTKRKSCEILANFRK